METDSVLTTREAVQFLKISKPTLLKYIHLGKIRAVKAGKGWKILRSELHQFLKGQMIEATAQENHSLRVEANLTKERNQESLTDSHTP